MESISSSAWVDVETPLSSFSSEESMIYSTSGSFDRRFSVISSSDSWDAGLSAGASSILTPSSLPSTPTHDEANRNGYLFWRQYPHMIPVTPDTKNSHTFYLEPSPHIHQDSPLSRYHFGSFPGDDDLPFISSSPLGSHTCDSTPLNSQRIQHGLRLPFETPSLDARVTQDAHLYRTRASRAGPLDSSYTLLSMHENSTPLVKSDVWSNKGCSPAKSDHSQRSSGWISSSNTVAPSSTIVKSDYGSPFLSGSTADALTSSGAILEDDDYVFKSPLGSDSDTVWNSTPSKLRKKSLKQRRVRGGTKSKLREVGPEHFRGNMRHMTDSILAINVPPKTHSCEDCPRKFSRKEHLKRHMKVHAPEYLHSCALPDTICAKKFGRTDNRMQHYATHLKTKRGQAERNKVVEFNFLCKCIRSQEDPEVAEKTISKLGQKRRQQELEQRTESASVRFFHVKGKKD